MPDTPDKSQPNPPIRVRPAANQRSMRDRAVQLAKTVVNRAIAPIGVKIVRVDDSSHNWSDTKEFIPFAKTLADAKRAGLSVGDYIDNVMSGTPGATQATIDQMSQLGVFSDKIDVLVEIGPGSGRYLDKTIAACAPTRVEIYETAGLWADYLTDQYSVILQRTDGKSLAATPDSSVDLVQAHKVFSSVSFITTVRYWLEMCRVLRPGGFAAFDIVTEACMDPTAIGQWVLFRHGADSAYPAVVPRALAVDFFASHSLSLVGSFFIPMGPSSTETFVFKKKA